MGLGTQPYGFGPAGLAYPNPSEENRGQLHSSRKIDAKAGKYTLATDGSNAIDGMDDILQTVYLLVARNVKRQPFITEQDKATTRAQVAKALRPLTTGKTPYIKLLKVLVGDDAKQTTWLNVQFKNLRSGTQQSVDL